MEPETLYRRLQQHLDRMPIGFPAAKSGIDIKILQRLFTPEEARITLNLSAIPEPAATIHKRFKKGMSLDELTRMLDQMSDKGIILSFPIKGERCYGKMIFAVGIFEQQITRLTREFARDALEYLQEDFGKAFHTKKTTQMRIVPVNKKIPVERNVARHDDIRAFVEASAGPFAKLTCICRHGKDLLGDSCKQTSLRENCLTMGMGARFAVDRMGASFISREEMLELLDAADREGLVLQTENTKKPHFVCCCCGCCCGVLSSVKRFPSPAEYFSSNFYAKVDPEACQSCGTCEVRCQLEAITSGDDGKTNIDRSRCAGCGLCVSTCPSDAIELVAKDASKVPPDDTRALYMKILQERYGPWGTATIAVRKLLGMKI